MRLGAMGSGETRPVRRDTTAQPGPAGVTRRKNASSTGAGSGAVRNVAVSQTIVVTPTVTSKVCANPSGELSNTWTAVSESDTIRAAVMAEISDQAFTRHQYHRRM